MRARLVFEARAIRTDDFLRYFLPLPYQWSQFYNHQVIVSLCYTYNLTVCIRQVNQG